MKNYQRAKQLLLFDKSKEPNIEIFEADFRNFLTAYFSTNNLIVEKTSQKDCCRVSISFDVVDNVSFNVSK